MAAYYRKIKGKNYDRELLELAEASVSGRGDGRISKSDAQALLAGVKDADSYTDVEKRTIKYIRENFKFTKEADALFRSEIRIWAGIRGARSRKKTESAPAPAFDDAPDKMGAHDDSAGYEPPAAAGSGEQSGFSWWKWLLIAIVIIILIILIFLGVRHCNNQAGNNQAGNNRAGNNQNMNRQDTDQPDKTGGLKPGSTPVTAGNITAEQVEKTVPAFRRGSSALSPSALKKLKFVNEYMAANPKSRLRITGHTCSLGGKKANLRYSRLRAGSVARDLRARGIESNRIEVRAAGESSPIASNKTEAGRRKNRRVQFKILN